MAKVVIELTEVEYEALKKLALEQKRSPKGQAEWMIEGLLREDEKVWVKINPPKPLIDIERTYEFSRLPFSMIDPRNILDLGHKELGCLRCGTTPCVCQGKDWKGDDPLCE